MSTSEYCKECRSYKTLVEIDYQSYLWKGDDIEGVQYVSDCYCTDFWGEEE